MPLSSKVTRILKRAHQFPEARWLFIRVESEQDVTDVKSLVSLKARPVRKTW